MDEKDDLKRALDTWQVPPSGPALDYRMLASYRGEMLNVPWWKRLLQAHISIPVPVAIALTLIVLLLLVWRGYGVAPLRPTESVLRQASDYPCGDLTAPRQELHSLVAGSSQGATYVTVGDFSKFRPVKDSKITIETKGRGR